MEETVVSPRGSGRSDLYTHVGSKPEGALNSEFKPQPVTGSRDSWLHNLWESFLTPSTAGLLRR